MWARRLGIPHLWPSRVKVFFLGMLTSMFNFSVFQYLHNANVEYLDLESPAKRDIVCKLPRQECLQKEDPAACTVLLEDRQFWRGMNLSKPCPLPPQRLRGQTCLNPTLPLESITGELGSLHTVNSGVNPFKLWSILFLILTSLLSLSIVIHDLALLQETLRPKILSIPNMKYATPCLWDCLTCVPCRRHLQRHCVLSRSRCVWTLLVPFITVFQVVAFMVVMYPFSLLVCLVAPVKMSRIMVFLSSILCILWSIIFVLVTALVDSHSYAVLWGLSERPEEASSLSCVCLCEFPLSRSVVARVVVLGIGVCWQSFNLTFRALRGLRRAQWANMFSVLYAIPIEAFPVTWERPQEVGGGPILGRCEGEAVQSEPAFDPFCLMDEQPESGWTRVLITPVSKTEQQQFVWDPYTGTLDTEIGCCGFPRPVRLSEEEAGALAELGAPRTASEEEAPIQRISRGPVVCAAGTDEHAITTLKAAEGVVLGRPSSSLAPQEANAAAVPPCGAAAVEVVDNPEGAQILGAALASSDESNREEMLQCLD